jgi:hypothetical protein
MNETLNRLGSPTPKYFRKIRNIGLLLASVGGAIVALPIALPAIVVTIATYGIAVGTSITTIASLVKKIENDEIEEKPETLNK